MSDWGHAQTWDESQQIEWQDDTPTAWTHQQKEILLKDLNSYLQTDEWKTVFSMFVSSNCAVFDDPQQEAFSEGQTELWNKFKDFVGHQVNDQVHHYSAQGITVFRELLQLAQEVLADPDIEEQLYITAQTKNLMKLVTHVEDFGKYMAERNQEMEAEAMAGSDNEAVHSDGGESDTGHHKHHRHKHGKHERKNSKHKSRKLRKLRTAKLLRRPSERFLDAVMAQPDEAEGAEQVNNQAEKWKCLYCNSMNAHDARSCILCGLAPATESTESLVKRCKKARRVVSDFVSKQKFDNVKTVAKRWVARAAHLEVVAHMLYADDRPKDAIRLVEGHSAICKSYSNLRSAYLTSLNSRLTLYMSMCEWEKAQEAAELAYKFCVEQNFVDHIENPWTPDFGELKEHDAPASAFQTDDSHVMFVETPDPFTDTELQEMNLQYLVLLMNICTLYTLYQHEEGGQLADDYCARYAEHLHEPRLISFLRRRLTVLIEVYLSRKQHNQAASLSQQLSSAVMSSPLLTEPLLMSACIQCAKSVVEVLLAQGADVEAVGTNGCTALFSAVRSKSYAEQMTKMLLDSHANPDRVDNDGCTSLHYAASTGNSALVAMLMGFGADTNVTDNYGSLPADYAAQVRDTESQLLLLNVESARDRLQSAASSHDAGGGQHSGEEGKGAGGEDDVDSSGSGSGAGGRGSEWVECFDEESGYPFFVNTVTGESEWASADVWAEHEREIQEQMAAAAAPVEDGWAEYSDAAGTGVQELDEGDRQAWHEVNNVRSDMRALNSVATELAVNQREQHAAISDMQAKYDEVLAGTQTAMDKVKAELAGLHEQQLAGMAEEMAKRDSELEMSRKQSAANLAAETEKVAKQQAEIAQLREKEEAMKEKLRSLEKNFQEAQKKKQEAQESAAKEGLKLEMKQHVAMKEKEKIISNFKDNLKALDEGLAKERSRHRLNLLKKLQLRREKNARRKSNGKLPDNLQALRPKAPPPAVLSAMKPSGPPPGVASLSQTHPSTAPARLVRTPAAGGGGGGGGGDGGEAKHAGPQKSVSVGNLHVATPPAAATVSNTAARTPKMRQRRRKPPPPPPSTSARKTGALPVIKP